jgi:hypothetical protein
MPTADATTHGALNFALKINLPGLHATHMAPAAAYGQLGQHDEAGKAVQELLKLQPGIAQIARPAFGMRFEPEFVPPLIEGLRKAGLDMGWMTGNPETDPLPTSRLTASCCI